MVDLPAIYGEIRPRGGIDRAEYMFIVICMYLRRSKDAWLELGLGYSSIVHESSASRSHGLLMLGENHLERSLWNRLWPRLRGRLTADSMVFVNSGRNRLQPTRLLFHKIDHGEILGREDGKSVIPNMCHLLIEKLPCDGPSRRSPFHRRGVHLLVDGFVECVSVLVVIESEFGEDDRLLQDLIRIFDVSVHPLIEKLLLHVVRLPRQPVERTPPG